MNYGVAVINNEKTIDILLVEDSPGDQFLTVEAFKAARLQNRIDVVSDGAEALDYLYRRGNYVSAIRPDLILLDLNLPLKDGREVLSEIKADSSLKSIPVIILTTSKAEEDIIKCYDLNCNAYISKPVNMAQFIDVAISLGCFWFKVVKLPHVPHTAD